jgi:malate/lactate dehydrogenase
MKVAVIGAGAVGSQASPTLQLAPGASTRPTASGFSSMIRTS